MHETGKYVFICAEHQEKLKIYCLECEKLMCGICGTEHAIKFKPPHNTIFINKVVEGKKKDINNNQENISQVIKDLISYKKQAVNSIKAILANEQLSKQHAKAIQQINKIFSDEQAKRSLATIKIKEFIAKVESQIEFHKCLVNYNTSKLNIIEKLKDDNFIKFMIDELRNTKKNSGIIAEKLKINEKIKKNFEQIPKNNQNTKKNKEFSTEITDLIRKVNTEMSQFTEKILETSLFSITQANGTLENIKSKEKALSEYDKMSKLSLEIQIQKEKLDLLITEASQKLSQITDSNRVLYENHKTIIKTLKIIESRKKELSGLDKRLEECKGNLCENGCKKYAGSKISLICKGCGKSTCCECAKQCKKCNNSFCKTCVNMLAKCRNCKDEYCMVCMKKCYNCSAEICKNCGMKCMICEEKLCNKCAANNKCNICDTSVCKKCIPNECKNCKTKSCRFCKENCALCKLKKCKKCMIECNICKKNNCVTCIKGKCEICKRIKCDLCTRKCELCNKSVCFECFRKSCAMCKKIGCDECIAKVCPICKVTICNECMKKVCPICQITVCNECIKIICPLCKMAICNECSKYCEVCKKTVCAKCIINCASCKKMSCTKCMYKVCSSCKKIFCDECNTKVCAGCKKPCCSSCSKPLKNCQKYCDSNNCPANCFHPDSYIYCSPCAASYKYLWTFEPVNLLSYLTLSDGNMKVSSDGNDYPSVIGNILFDTGIYSYQVIPKNLSKPNEGFGLCDIEIYNTVKSKDKNNPKMYDKMLGLFCGTLCKMTGNFKNTNDVVYTVTVDRIKQKFWITGPETWAVGNLDPKKVYAPCFSFDQKISFTIKPLPIF